MLLGDHVTTDTGTGVVHTAPSHGIEDFNVWQEYGRTITSPTSVHTQHAHLWSAPILCPVDDCGLFTHAAGAGTVQ